jgi:hypothetical protein
MADIKLTSDKGDMKQRVADRLKSSGEGASPDWMVKKGEGPNRTITHGHHSGSVGGTKINPKDKGNG